MGNSQSNFARGTKLAARIDFLGYHLYQVADGSGVNRWDLNDYLHRRRHISPLHLQRLALFLQCEPEALYE